jgi:hypothetical protein
MIEPAQASFTEHLQGMFSGHQILRHVRLTQDRQWDEYLVAPARKRFGSLGKLVRSIFAETVDQDFLVKIRQGTSQSPSSYGTPIERL